jgi:hypothetical protein
MWIKIGLLQCYFAWTWGHMFIICWSTGQATRKLWSGHQKKHVASPRNCCVGQCCASGHAYPQTRSRYADTPESTLAAYSSHNSCPQMSQRQYASIPVRTSESVFPSQVPEVWNKQRTYLLSRDSEILNLEAEPFQSVLPGCGMPYTVMSKTIPQTQHSGDNSKRIFSENSVDRRTHLNRTLLAGKSRHINDNLIDWWLIHCKGL